MGATAGAVALIRGVARQGVVQVADEVVAVLAVEGHEGPAHEDELHLVRAVAQLLRGAISDGAQGRVRGGLCLQLVDPALGL